MARFKQGETVIVKSGEYECEVLKIVAETGGKAQYRLEDLTTGMTFTEYESGLASTDETIEV